MPTPGERAPRVANRRSLPPGVNHFLASKRVSWKACLEDLDAAKALDPRGEDDSIRREGSRRCTAPVTARVGGSERLPLPDLLTLLVVSLLYLAFEQRPQHLVLPP
jgi:hypothetical protein